MLQRIPLDNDEKEVACDLLRFVKRETGLSGVAEALWERLQPIRHGDYAGSASTELSVDEARAVIVAGEFTTRAFGPTRTRRCSCRASARC